MHKVIAWVAVGSAVFLAGCTPAHIALSPAMAGAERLQITGMGFGERGTFALGSSSGRFYRQALSERQRAFPRSAERVTTYGGGSGFEVQGPDFSGIVRADCAHFEREAGTGTYTVTVEPFRYRCRFTRDGQPIPGELVLHAAPRAVGPLTAETRIGHLALDGRSVTLQPIHHSPGLKIPTSEPLGYRVVSPAGEIGAVDLNGERKTIYAPRDGADREAVLIASLALSVLWRS